MRWTNYFIHPGDNRYYVFSFKKKEYSNLYETALLKHEIPFESYIDEELEYGAKYLFGIPRTHLTEAMRENNLLHAKIRTPFIPSKILRWTVLIITGALLTLAIIGAMSQKAFGQQMANNDNWELAVQTRLNTPFAIVGVETQEFSTSGLTALWIPKMSQAFGVRLQYRFKENWTFGTGVLWFRKNYSIELNYSNDSLAISTTDTIQLLRAVGYRIPFMAETRVPLGLGYFVTSAAGLGIEITPSDVFVNGSTSDNGSVRDFEVYMGRWRWASIPLMAELGIEKEPRGEIPGWYLGLFWSRSIGKSIWVEQVVSANYYRVVGSGFLNSTVTGIELRVLLK
jgi:hypothetical protein